MAQKKSTSTRSFYLLLLTALLGMFLFVTYYAVQQVQVYRSSAGCSHICTAGLIRCDSGNVQTCISVSGGACTNWSTTKNCPNGCTNGKCSGGAPSTVVSTQQSITSTSTSTTTCKKRTEACGPGKNCCSGLSCINGFCQSSTCGHAGAVCGPGENCCLGPANLHCVNGKCAADGGGGGGGGNCQPHGAPCGNLGGSGCCSSTDVCRNKNAQGVGICAVACSSKTDQTSCTATTGCTWQNNACTACQGTTCPTVVCGNITDQTTCQANTSCTWNSSTNTCGTNCTTLTNQTSCTSAAGCSWNSSSNTCSATATSCSQITDRNSCNANSQCHWFEAGGFCGASCSTYIDQSSCTTGGCGWNSDLQCCGNEPPCVSGGGGGTGTPTPTPTGGGGGTASVTLNLTLSFQGINQAPASGENSMNVKVTLGSGPSNQTISSTGTFTADSNGVWTGSVSFSGVTTGSGYKVLVKGPKHIQKKICDATPSESALGTYHCGDGNITINSGSNNFDFSGIKLLVGDLPPQDGIVDSYDISLVRNSLCTTANPTICKDSATLVKADLNLDGIIDTQDYSLLISSLEVKYDEN